VVDSFSNGHAFVGIELQRTLEEIVDLRGDELELLGKGSSLTNSEGFNVVSGTLVTDEVDICGRANLVEDDGSKKKDEDSWS
jgi:hypothetical protein